MVDGTILQEVEVWVQQHRLTVGKGKDEPTMKNLDCVFSDLNI
jgi:hypothetical protein